MFIDARCKCTDLG